jgi:hypothetical protein
VRKEELGVHLYNAYGLREGFRRGPDVGEVCFCFLWFLWAFWWVVWGFWVGEGWWWRGGGGVRRRRLLLVWLVGVNEGRAG